MRFRDSRPRLRSKRSGAEGDFMKMRIRILPSIAVTLFLASSAALAQSPDRAALEAEIRALLVELKSTEQQFLAPSAKDQRKYADFLAQPDTGMIRLLPREIFQNKLTIREGGAYYSFTGL